MSAEDILQESLSFLGEDPIKDEANVTYGPLKLSIARKEGKANTLLADHLFSPALFLAERIERNLLDAHTRTVIELGAGAGLPSLLLSTIDKPPSLVVITDYPDETILSNLQRNIEDNRSSVSESCQVTGLGYEWGQDTRKLRELTPNSSGYDIVILSDLLHFNDSHDVLIRSLTSLLSRRATSRAHISAGNYTQPHVCDNFVQKATKAGIRLEEWTATKQDKEWLGSLPVSGLSKDDLALRKSVCRYWIGRWAQCVIR